MLTKNESVRTAREKDSGSIASERAQPGATGRDAGRFLSGCKHMGNWNIHSGFRPSTGIVKNIGFVDDALFTEAEKNWKLKPVNYDVSHRFTFVKGRAQVMCLSQTLAMMDLLRVAHGVQQRRSNTDLSVLIWPIH